MSERGWTAINLFFLAVVAVLLLRPSGPIGAKVAVWRAARADRAVTIRLWPRIAQGSSRFSGLTNEEPSIVVFTDYQCPFCKQLDHALDSLLIVHPEVRIAYRHFPLSIHSQAIPAAAAALCAERQGVFPRMHHQLFNSTEWVESPDWLVVAERAHVPNPGTLVECMKDSAVTRRVEADLQLGKELNITGTPVLVTPSKKVQGSMQVAELSKLLD